MHYTPNRTAEPIQSNPISSKEKDRNKRKPQDSFSIRALHHYLILPRCISTILSIWCAILYVFVLFLELTSYFKLCDFWYSMRSQKVEFLLFCGNLKGFLPLFWNSPNINEHNVFSAVTKHAPHLLHGLVQFPLISISILPSEI